MTAKKLQSVSVKVIAILCLSIFVFGCSLLGISFGKGTVSLALTDAPITDAEDVEGVFITIESIAYNLNGDWVDAADFSGPQEFNLLELTGGEVAPLADTVISAGEVTQIRFMLSATEQGQTASDTPDCYILIDPDGTADGVDVNDVKYDLFVPSGGETGYKANGPFTVPRNGTVEITADFDVRKSVELTGEGTYILKPTIRLIVNDQAGSIEGTFTDDATDGFDSYVVFAYEDDAYESSEATATTPFRKAISSASAEDSDEDTVIDSYALPFLAAGTYDLIFAGVAADGTYSVIDETHTDIVVVSELTTTENIDLLS